MTHWILIHNPNYFDLDRLVLNRDTIDWHQGRNRYDVGDIVYLYSSAPEKRIKYRGTVIDTDISELDVIDDSPYWKDGMKFDDNSKRWIRIRIDGTSKDGTLGLDDLRRNGLTTPMKGPTKRLSDELLRFIEGNIETDRIEYPDSEGMGKVLKEGAVRTVRVNAYERNPIARMECIKNNGCYCHICGIDFADIYGEFASGFIHVHHIVPIHKIKDEYVIDPSKDLIPVCPNRHAMLHHRREDGGYYSVDELKDAVMSRKRTQIQ